MAIAALFSLPWSRGEETWCVSHSVEQICPAAEATKGKALSKEEILQNLLRQKLLDIQNGEDINAVDKDGQTALMHAAALKNQDAVCWLVAKGADVTLKNNKGKNALDYTDHNNIRELLEFCLHENEPLELDEKKQAALARFIRTVLTKHAATSDRSCTFASLANALKTGEDIARQARVGTWGVRPTQLAYLVRHGYDINTPLSGNKAPYAMGHVRLLLALGVKVDPQTQKPEELLQLAIDLNDTKGIAYILNKHPELVTGDILNKAKTGEMVRVMITAGADVKSYNLTQNLTNVDVVEEILNAGADIEKGDNEIPGHPLITMAALRNAPAGVYKALLKAGAKVKYTPNGTPLHRLKNRDDIEEIVSLLIKAGVKIDTQEDVEQNTALHHAAWIAQDKLTLALLKNGANVNILNTYGRTPLQQALMIPDKLTPAIAESLISAGTDLNVQDKDGNTALMLCCASPGAPATEVLRLLLKKGAKTELRNKKNETALQIARMRNNTEALQLLEAHKVNK